MDSDTKECPCCTAQQELGSNCETFYVFPSMTHIDGFGYKCTICSYLEETNGK